MVSMSGYRSEFPVSASYAYLNHAAVAPLPRRVAAVLADLATAMSCHGISGYPAWMKRVAEVRGLFARLMGADAEDIAFVTNTSEGLSAVAGGIAWRPGDGVLVSRPDFPALIYPWLDLERKGVDVAFVTRREGRIDPDDVRKVLKPGARLLAVSSVDFLTGYACDLQALGDLCRREGLLFCVDAIQGLGVLPVDVKACGIHFLASGGQKWLLGPMGCGVLYVDSGVADLIHPSRIGWKSVVNDEDFFDLRFELKHGAAVHEPGTLNVMGIYALGAALELLMEVGIGAVRDRIFRLNDAFAAGLADRRLEIVTPMGEGERSGILTFKPHGNALDLFTACMASGVLVSERGGLIRLSPHFYNDESDVARFFGVLDEARSKGL